MKAILKKFLPWQSEFDHHYACWANNHEGWAKMKKANKKLAKVKMNRAICKQIQDEIYIEDYENVALGD